MTNDILIKVKDLKKYFPVKNGIIKNTVIKAVDGVSFDIKRGETFGLVGESGCGKSTLGRTITRLYDVTDGDIFFDGTNIAKLNKKQMREYYKKMQIIFQDPYSSLNPYMNVKELIDEPIALHTSLGKAERAEKIEKLLEMVGLKKNDMEKFPHEFSGGQCQRIGIARAVSTNPDFVLCDEPISALDVSIQAQVVNMLEDLQKEMGLTYLFVAHDLSMVRHISDRIGVMYLGSIVEIGISNDLYKKPLHPYTKGLLSSIPIADPIKAKESTRDVIEGDIPSPINIPSGCRFHTRCPYAKPICAEVPPIAKEVENGHFVTCHLY
ncbi:oligopeptide transport system ATP-binding protein [Clostridium saccharoperbutylacetonicum]|uniref:Oligopeptide transport ATP-binding protein AppF n=1 Tax=Clostridium saccharoperbutylacetonicum N1-4(HMT) TaxID=931276 RepID=M1MUE1_9CLOT|nr:MULTISPECIES: ABC transporter ATP-binding protein [Clostridium]AGF55162.1 oligopeptide transport ATP-binding protein AppF [Clostridium saccharoperbutylacetonicum N1-4(HMT)]NRT64127.1 oligopeptide transport system ATP-binding protein [Clostridium saccharoperbutylacetonicum]NSB27494.1 oligopeptide transport system ATP-binding protein [Clostridium saccharoperbutylacetonicum]NSB40983.1 oligopeptide transport system ATP-binding protein [Clostridium saccharoperbutylacetonicum]